MNAYVVFESLIRRSHQLCVVNLEAMMSPLKRTDFPMPVTPIKLIWAGLKHIESEFYESILLDMAHGQVSRHDKRSDSEAAALVNTATRVALNAHKVEARFRIETTQRNRVNAHRWSFRSEFRHTIGWDNALKQKYLS